MRFKGFLAGAAVLLGSTQAFAYDPNAIQRGWVDSIGNEPYPDFIAGPTTTMSIRGWACVRPGATDYGVPSTQVAVSHGTVSLPVLEVRQTVYRPDVVAYGACSGYYRGFVVWVAKPVSYPSNYYVAFLGPYGTTYLEGQSYY
jgi:hypothetical protein